MLSAWAVERLAMAERLTPPLEQWTLRTVTVIRIRHSRTICARVSGRSLARSRTISRRRLTSYGPAGGRTIPQPGKARRQANSRQPRTDSVRSLPDSRGTWTDSSPRRTTSSGSGESIKASDQSAAARGGALSGNALRAQYCDWPGTLRAGEYNNYVNNLFRAMGYGHQRDELHGGLRKDLRQ